MTINQIQDELISDFELFDDWESKYEYIIDLGKQFPPLEEQYKTEDNIIKGCQSRVWLHAYMDDGLLKFEADSDAIIVRGLVSMLVKVLSGRGCQRRSLFYGKNRPAPAFGPDQVQRAGRDA
jgi:cysteine desulfuration protein SufE